MDFDLVAGTAITALSVAVVAVLYVWSTRRIDLIHAKKLTSLRQIQKELKHGDGTD